MLSATSFAFSIVMCCCITSQIILGSLIENVKIWTVFSQVFFYSKTFFKGNLVCASCRKLVCLMGLYKNLRRVSFWFTFRRNALCLSSKQFWIDICWQVNMSIAILPMAAENSWSPTTVGLIQSSFFWGYLLTQVRHYLPRVSAFSRAA